MKGEAEEIFMTLLTKEKKQVPVLINAATSMANGTVLFRFAGIPIQQRLKFEEEIIAAKKAAEKALNENTSLLQAKQELQQHAEQLDRQMVLAQKQNGELRQFNHVVTHDLQ
jgi:sigma-B regulation protein RsbU (phosphoserine phosphatase)